MSDGRLPEPPPIPITAGNGPVPAGNVICEVSMRVCPFLVIYTVSESPA